MAMAPFCSYITCGEKGGSVIPGARGCIPVLPCAPHAAHLHCALV